jgi:LPXTG-motif cell wall-anchored protein
MGFPLWRSICLIDEAKSKKEIDNLMKHFRSITLAALAGCIGVLVVPTIRADDRNKKTIMTVTEPLQMPSCCTPDHTVTLQPGKYVMVLADSMSDRHIVQVFDETQTHLITTILAIPNQRLQATGKTVFQYWEVPAGQPRALRAWFYPGDNFGQEFAYHKRTAVAIAAYVKTPVPAIEIDTTSAEELKSAPLVIVDESGNTNQPPPVSALPQVAFQEPVETAQAARQEPAPAEPQSLPHTASAMPLLGLAGLVSLALFAALGLRSRRALKA